MVLLSATHMRPGVMRIAPSSVAIDDYETRSANGSIVPSMAHHPSIVAITSILARPSPAWMAYSRHGTPSCSTDPASAV